MAQPIALIRRIEAFAAARTVIVSACASALILAGRFVPFG